MATKTETKAGETLLECMNLRGNVSRRARVVEEKEPIRTTQRPMADGRFAYPTRRLAGFSYLDSLAAWKARRP